MLVLLVLGAVLAQYVLHSTWMAAENFSSPSFIMSNGHQKTGDKYILDDFREAYYWLKQNTDKDSKILSWWDYGYQITGMSNRTVIVDNNTWNNTHIATVAKCLISDEEEGYRIAKSLDAKYVLVVFGGYAYYTGDDLAKFLWFVRIAGSVWPKIDERDYYKNGNFGPRSWELSDKMKESLTYKMLYNQFGSVLIYNDEPPGYDRARHGEIAHKDIQFKHFKEVYTSQQWMVRIYEVLPEENRAARYEGVERRTFI